jgi:hypothetical protein
VCRSFRIAFCAIAVCATALTPGFAAATQRSGDAPPAVSDGREALEAAGVRSCLCEDEILELERYRDLVAAAATVEEAREKAAWPSRLARRALALTGFVRPDDERIDAIRARLEAYEERVRAAESTRAAADEFEGLVQLAGSGDVKAAGCSYDGTEIIAIIFGFLLFIIPGIILLFVFC